jgi:hypothetical protein
MSEPSTGSSGITAATAAALQTPPARGPAIVNTLGGALAAAGFFLPWVVTAQFQPSSGTIQATVVTGWDLVMRWLTGTVPQPTGAHVNGLTSIPYALLAGMPLVMAVIAVAVGASAIFRRPGPLLSGLYIAAGIMGVLSAFNSFPLYALTLGGAIGQAGPGTELSGLGIVVTYAGFFGVIVGGVASALTRSRPAAS